MSFDNNSFRLDGKVVVVTGAAAGIGRGIAELFASAGASVVVSDRDGDAAATVAAAIGSDGGDAVAAACDVTAESDLAALVDLAVATFGGLDILVNNAGILRDRVVVNMTEEEWDAVVDVHLKGHFAPSRWAAAGASARIKLRRCRH